MFKNQNHSKKRFHLSIISAILWINLLSLFAVASFNYYIFHHKNAKAYKENFLSYNLKVTSLAFKNVDQQIIQAVLNLPKLYFSPIQENAPILLPQSQSIAGSSKDIRSLVTELQKISKSHPYIAGMDIYYEATNTVVTHFNNVHFPTDQQQLDRYLPWYTAYLNMNSGEKQDCVWITMDTYLSDAPALLYINRIPRLNRWEKDIVLCAYINPDSFSEYMDQTIGNLLISTREGQLLYNSRTWEGELPPPLSPSGATEIRESDGFMVFQNTSPVSGLSYYYAIDSDSFYQDYISISHMFLFNFLLSILFNVIMLLIITWYNHSAYHSRIHVLSENTGIPIGKSGKSFDGSLNILEKEIFKLHEAVESSRGLMFQKAIQAELFGEASKMPEPCISPWLTMDSCCVVLLSLPQADVDTLPIEEFQEDYPAGLKDYNVLFAAANEQSLAAVLIFDQGCQEQVRADFINDMDSRLKDYQLISGSISSVKEGGIAESYRCAAEAARYQYIFTKDRFLSYDLLHISRRKNDGSHLKLFDAIQKDINSTNLLDLKLHIEMLITSFKSGNYTIDYCQATLRDLVSLLYRIMQQNQLDTWSVFGYDIRAYYKKIENIDRFQSWCNSICETMLKQMNQKRQSVDEGLRQKILNIIDEHLEKDITLDFLADQLQIRSNSASRLFRQVMGTGYTEYIKTRKLKRAEELIARGLPVKDIAEKLGYSTPQYFIKVFKENYGMTPLQYKKAHEQDSLPERTNA